MYRDIPQNLRALVEPVIEDHGLELVDAELARAGGRCVVRIVVDTPAGDGRVPVERCAEVSREIESCIDAEESLPDRYRLEVSSPGLDRVLGREKDFAAARGHEVKLETRQAIDGRKRFRGRLLDFDGRVARLLVDGAECAIDFEAVARANQVYEYSGADFGRPKGSSRKSRRAARARAAASGEQR